MLKYILIILTFQHLIYSLYFTKNTSILAKKYQIMCDHPPLTRMNRSQFAHGIGTSQRTRNRNLNPNRNPQLISIGKEGGISRKKTFDCFDSFTEVLKNSTGKCRSFEENQLLIFAIKSYLKRELEKGAREDGNHMTINWTVI